MQNVIEKSLNKQNDDEENGEEKKKQRPIVKSATDLQRLKLEKLMKNPDKPILIPESPREKDYMQTVPSFVRNVMGSSAGAGSGEFHVYRHLRRKEYARQKCIHAKSMREQLDEEYQLKLEKNKSEADAKTAKKRAKRLKKKQRAKKPKTGKNDDECPEKLESKTDQEENEDGTSSENENEEKITEEIVPAVEEQANDNNVELSKEISESQEKAEISSNVPNLISNEHTAASETCLEGNVSGKNGSEVDKLKNEKQIGVEAAIAPRTKEQVSENNKEQKTEVEELVQQHNTTVATSVQI